MQADCRPGKTHHGGDPRLAVDSGRIHAVCLSSGHSGRSHSPGHPLSGGGVRPVPGLAHRRRGGGVPEHPAGAGLPGGPPRGRGGIPVQRGFRWRRITPTRCSSSRPVRGNCGIYTAICAAGLWMPESWRTSALSCRGGGTLQTAGVSGICPPCFHASVPEPAPCPAGNWSGGSS